MSAAARVQLSRAVLASSALVGAAIVWLAVAQLHPVYGSAIATVVAAGALWLVRGVFSRRRVVLWLEERVPALRYSLVTLEDAPATTFRASLEEVVGRARLTRPLIVGAARLVGIPILLFLAAQLAVRPLVERLAASGPAAGPGRRDGPRAPGFGPGRLQARVTTPAYAGGRSESMTNPAAIGALVGSEIRFSGDWSEATRMPARPTVLRLDGARGTRVVALEPRQDSTPRIVLELPARDSTLASVAGTLQLAAQARDDIGLRDAWFELIVSSGSGESFTFRNATLGRVDARNARAARIGTTLRLDSLALKPGDVVHLRAVARDANPSADAEAGSSETRTLRVPRPGENDSVSIVPAPPPEVGQSEVSQRMLIILTERIVARMQRMSTDAVRRELAPIARDQGRLRKRVGEIIFSRLTGEEHSEGDGHDHGTALQDSISPAEALLRAADAATNADIGHSHGDEGPVVGVNRPLLEAFNAMWDAERELNVTEPRRALPHMRAALDAIQRARAAERLYLRGRAPRVVIDEARIRLAGKRDEMSPATRSARPSTTRDAIARRTRFSAALEMLQAGDTGGPPAAIDSLMVLRIDVIEQQPMLAAALSRAIEELRSGRDATESLIAARRALDGPPVRGRELRWGGGW
jgi:hypothetical protein